ncbi:class I SAM-dependent methyltransferase [Desulfovibrio mangrovi]|uniref:class I SAM-dependent methyltransferase n=1 Tax=Desulfovibrio mangrovi TaxID=2976983 RepID=UPI002247C2FB|nr:class I SAM-dependent methyltransferase [Desulfovibrio mangrovi]UZP66884.1 class I SAM-dependent methyltransferase [Desulfovibrio mangrovi]
MSNLDRDRDIYLQENRYKEPKEIFKHLAALLEERVGVRPGLKVCDIGCAAGEFLYHVRDRWSQLELCGFDPSRELVEKARSVMPGETFFVGSVMETQTLAPASQDVVFMSGVHSGIRDMKQCLANILSWLKPGGTAYLFGIFNPYPIDVQASYVMSGDEGEPTLFYVHSCKSVSGYLDAIDGVTAYSFTKFHPPVDIAYRESNPFRAWTIRDDQGEGMLVNGLSMVVHCFVMEIVK